MYFQSDDYDDVYWSPLLMIPVGLLSYLLFTTKYITIFNCDSKEIEHTICFGAPCHIISFKQTLRYDEVVDVQITVPGCRNPMYLLELVLHDGSRKMLIIDGDRSQAYGYFWRVRDEILEWLGRRNERSVQSMK